jgi:hypothetical protein
MTDPSELENALEKAVLEAITENFTLDWSSKMDVLYDALVEDLKKNAEVDAHLCMQENSEGEDVLEDGSELYISPYMNYTSVGEILPLSELLIDAVDCYGKEAVSQALEVSLARFRAEDQED